MREFPDTIRNAVRDPETRRRAGAFGAAGLAHAVGFALLLAAPLQAPSGPAGPGRAIDVRLYTVAGENAETDAPLNEPPLAGAGAGEAGAEGEAGRSGAGADADEADTDEAGTDVTGDDAASEETPTASDLGAPDLAEPEPSQAEPEARLLTAPGGETSVPAGPASDPDTAAAARRVAGPPSQPPPPGEPVETTQDLPEAPARRRGPPTFAEIAERAAERPRAERFITADLRGGVAQAVRESFCTSSSDANRAAFDCVELPDELGRRLAEMGLSGFGEQGPEFLVDMDRLEFQLRQLGDDAPLLETILTYRREARRNRLATPGVQRALQGDDARIRAQDNLGLGNNTRSIPTPDNPGG